MLLDKASQAIHTEDEIFESLMCGEVTDAYVETAETLNNQIKDIETQPWLVYPGEPDNLQAWDKENQSRWKIPEPFLSMDVRSYVLSLCRNQIDVERVNIELDEYEKRGLVPLLRWLAYVVYLFNRNNIIYGVGRGSSSASQVLFLMGVHKIDAIKYELDFFEFMR